MKNLQKIYWLAVVLLMLAVLALPTGPSQAQAAAGFHISGRNLLDANGNNFIMRGVSHPHTWYPSQTSSFANIKATGANTVRVVLSGGRWTKNTASDVANVINLCKTNKLICVLENHDTTGYGEDGAAVSLSQAVTYWKEIQSVLTGQEAYIIINIGNEPYGNNNASAWVNDTKNAIAELRSAGFEHTIMVDAPNWGQDWSFVMRNNAASIFESDPDKNLIFSIHMYGVFDTASEVQSYVSTFVSAGLPLVIGEFGHDHSDGNPDEDAIMAQAQANGVGYIGWSWSGNGGGVEYLDMVTSFNPAQLTSWGEQIVNGANGIRLTSVEASVYGGPTSTPCVDCTPTHTFTPPPPTITPTTTNTPNVNGALKVQLVTGGTDNNQQSAFHYRVQNTGANAVSNVSVRIYFSLDGSQSASSYVLEKYYDQSGVATIAGPTQVSGSSYYFTVNYGTTSLPVGAAWEYHTALRLSNWSQNYSSSNDWWRASGSLPASYADWTNIPAYLSGSLNWGSESGGGPTHTPTATETMTRTPTATPSASRTPTPTTCPMATPEPLRVEPVISPSDQTTQVITVRTNNSDSVTVALESGSFTVTGNFTTANPALVTVSLLPNTEHHLIVSAHIKPVIGPGGCTYGGYTLSTRNDRYGMPLTIVQSDVIDPTLTPTPTITRLPPIIVEGYVRVGSSTGPGLPQVVITTWFGSPHGQVTTDANGYYRVVFPRPLNQETVSLTPQLAGYTFSPDSYAWILYSGDTGPFTRDFIATPAQNPACSPVTATITAPFSQDGAGTHCWQTSNLGSFINSWNLASLTINGVDFTNKYVSASSYPARIDGFWYVSYTGNFPWSHFEAK